MATVLDMAIVSALDALQSFAHQENFWNLFEIAFGSGYDRPTVQRLRAQWQAGDTGIFPTLAVVTQEILGTASGAYGNGTIYLSDQFLANASETGVVRVLLEEYGHFVDAQVNTLDSPGDEGEIFAALVH